MAEFLIADLKCPTCGREFEDKAVFRAHMEFHARKKPFKCTECNYSSESQHRLDQHMHKHDRSRFTCDICEATFKWKGNLTLHMKLHSGEGLHECDECGKQCVTKSELARHMDRHNTEPKHKCKVCPKIFKHKQDLNQHMKLHTGVGLHKCKVCKHIFLSSKILRTHMESHATEPKYECAECGKKFKSRAMWQHHGRLHSKENVCVCPFCGKMFPVQSKLNKHLETHSVEPMFQCNLCPLKYKHERALQRHLNLVHYDKGTYMCTVCEKKFPSPSTLSYHMDSHSTEPKYECKDCGEKFKHQRKLRYHMKLHTGEGLLNCPVCKKTFFTQSALTGHMAVHMDIQPFECSLCGKRYKHSKALQLHLEDHDGTRQRFGCDQCDRTFKIKAELNQHMKLHSGQGLFRCEVCDKEYIKKCELISHMDTHSNEAQYGCEVCDKRYRHKKDLRQHMRIHSANAYSCDTCDKKFATKQQLGFHIVAHTTEAPHVCKTCGARFKYECSLVKHYRQHMYPTSKKEKVVLDVKPGEKLYKKVIDDTVRAKKRISTVTKTEKDEDEFDDSFAFPASPAPARTRRSTVMPEMVDALDADEVQMPAPPARARKVVALQEPGLFEDPNDPPMVYYEEIVHTAQDVPPPLLIMTMEDGQQSQVMYEIQAPDGILDQQLVEEMQQQQQMQLETALMAEDATGGAEEIEERSKEPLVWDEALGVNMKLSTHTALKPLGMQVPNINIAVNRLFPTLAEGRRTRGKKGDDIHSVDVEKLVKVGILNEFHDPVEGAQREIAVTQRKKPVPLSKKPMPLKLKKATMTKLHKKIDPTMAPALSSPMSPGGPPILEKISSILHEPMEVAEEGDGPPVLTKVQPAVTKGGRKAAAVTTPVKASTVIHTGRPTRSQIAAAAAAESPVKSPAKSPRGSPGKKPAPSPTKASKFKQEEGYEPYDWGFSDDETGARKKRAAAAAEGKTGTPRGRGRPLRSKAAPKVVEESEEEEGDEEEEEQEEEAPKTTTPRGRGRPRKVETPQNKEKDSKGKPAPTPPKATPTRGKAASPKATPPTRSLPQRSAATPQTRIGPSKVPPKPTGRPKLPPKATPPTKAKVGAKNKEAEEETPVKQLPLKKRPAAFKGVNNTPQSGEKADAVTPTGGTLDTSPIRKSARSQKPTERMLEYLQDKALVGKVKTEPGTEHVLELELTPGKPSRIVEVTTKGRKAEAEPTKGKVAQTKASKAEALKELKAKAEKLKKSALAMKRKASPSPGVSPPAKKAATQGDESAKRGRGRPRKDSAGGSTPGVPKGKVGRPSNSANPNSPSKSFKSRQSAAEMIEEFAANLMTDLKSKARSKDDEDYDSEDDEEQDPLKSSSGRRSNRSGSISGRSNQEDPESDVENPDLNWEHSRIIRRRASSEEEDDDEEEDIKIIRRARRASSKSPKAKQLTPGASPKASPAAMRKPSAPLGVPPLPVANEEEAMTVEIRAQPLKDTAAAAGVELVDDLLDDEESEDEAIENDHLEVEPAIEAAEEAAEEAEAEEAVEMETEGVVAVMQEAGVDQDAQEAVEEEAAQEADMAEEAAAQLTEESVEAAGPKPDDTPTAEDVANIEEQVGALRQRIAATTGGSEAQTEAAVADIRALTEQAQAAMHEVEPQMEVQEDMVELQMSIPVTVEQQEEEAATYSGASILQVPDIRIQAPSPIVDHGDMGVVGLETETYVAAPIEDGDGQGEAATNGIGEELLGAINDQVVEDGSVTKSAVAHTD